VGPGQWVLGSGPWTVGPGQWALGGMNQDHWALVVAGKKKVVKAPTPTGLSVRPQPCYQKLCPRRHSSNYFVLCVTFCLKVVGFSTETLHTKKLSLT
jgi:hypothetical protein